jgi:hypothetical protein
MSVTLIAKEPARALQASDYLGPASVVEVANGDIHVELPEGETVLVEPAFVVPYAPALGDVLLVITKGDGRYAIGVLHGTGKTVLSLPGDVEVRAEGGALRFFGEKGVEILGPEVSVHASKVRVVADAMTQKVGSFIQRVRGLLQVQTREMHTIVDETSVTKAKSASVLTEETMTINGKQIQLG